MKKILLGTSALVAAAFVSGAANAAETPKITLGGFSTFQAGFTGEDNDANLRAGSFRSDNVITVRVAGKSDAGLGYGAGIDLEADTSDNADSAGVNSERTFVYVDGSWGKLQGGSDYGVTKTMKVDAASIARGTGGIDGDFSYFVSSTTGNVFATPDLFLDYGSGQLGNESSQAINKISYYTPRFAGFQAGISYLFDTTGGDRGQSLSRADNTAGEAENVILGALSYEGKFSNVGVNVAATGEFGNAEGSANEDLRSYQLGAKVSYMGASLAGSYGNLGDSLRTKGTASDSSNYFWTVGGAYETGPFGASVTYLKSNYDNGSTNNKFSNLSLGVDYKVAAGLTPYVEVDFVKIDPTGTANDNDATVFLLGTQLAF